MATRSPKQRKGQLKKVTKPKDTCFVIMPFGGYFDSYYQDVYIPAIQKAGMVPRRADDLFRSSNIVQDIWRLTQTAKVILADLSGKNANVFYELGLAHAASKPVILVTENLDDVPFDLQGLRIIVYDKNISNWGDILTKKIVEAIQESLIDPKTTIPFVFLEAPKNSKQKVSVQQKDILEIKQEIESLRLRIEEDTQPSFSKMMRNVSKMQHVLKFKASPHDKEAITHTNITRTLITSVRDIQSAQTAPDNSNQYDVRLNLKEGYDIIRVISDLRILFRISNVQISQNGIEFKPVY